MRKVFLCLCVVIFSLGFIGCSNDANTAFMVPKDGAYTSTPQEYIDMVNQISSNQSDFSLAPIPSFTGADTEIEIGSFKCTLNFQTNEAGQITQIEISWDGTGAGPLENGYNLALLTIGMLSPDDAETVAAELDMLNTSKPMYSTEAISNGTRYSYDCYGNGVYSTLIIESVQS